MKSFFTFCCMLLLTSGWCQDLNGIWKGTLTQDEGGCFPVYYLEIQMQHKLGELKGISYDYYDTARYVKHQFSGRFNERTGRLVLIENKMLTVRIPADCVPCIKTYELQYKKEGTVESLSGRWKGHVAGGETACPPGNISLSRIVKPVFPIEDLFENDSLTKLKMNWQEKKREKELVNTIEVKQPNIEILLYDNAEIDNDTVTLTVNKQLIAYRARLSGKPLRFELFLQPDREYEFIMYADNLGEIPPNTALMIIHAGRDRYELRLSSSETRSSMVRLKYRPPDNYSPL